MPYGKLYNRNLLDLEEELLFRKVPLVDILEKLQKRKKLPRHLDANILAAEGITMTEKEVTEEKQRLKLLNDH